MNLVSALLRGLAFLSCAESSANLLSPRAPPAARRTPYWPAPPVLLPSSERCELGISLFFDIASASSECDGPGCTDLCSSALAGAATGGGAACTLSRRACGMYQHVARTLSSAGISLKHKDTSHTRTGPRCAMHPTTVSPAHACAGDGRASPADPPHAACWEGARTRLQPLWRGALWPCCAAPPLPSRRR